MKLPGFLNLDMGIVNQSTNKIVSPCTLDISSNGTDIKHTADCCTYFFTKEYQSSINYYFRCGFDPTSPIFVKVFKKLNKQSRCEYSDIQTSNPSLYQIFLKTEYKNPDGSGNKISKTDVGAIELLQRIIDKKVEIGFETDLTIAECTEVKHQQDTHFSIVTYEFRYKPQSKGVVDEFIKIVNSIRDLCDNNLFNGYWESMPTVGLKLELGGKYVHQLKLSFLFPNFSWIPFLLILDKNEIWDSPVKVSVRTDPLGALLVPNAKDQIAKFNKLYYSYKSDEEPVKHIVNNVIDIDEHSIKSQSKRKLKL